MAKFDIYEAISDRILSELEKGNIPWEKPWVCVGGSSSAYAVSYTTGKPYSLLNQMMLGESGQYLTFNQIQAVGGRVKKGEKSRMVVFWKWLKVKDEQSETGEKEIPFLRYFNVFHINQCEGVPEKCKKPEALPADPASADETAEKIIREYLQREGVTLSHTRGDRAFYRPSTDSVTLPDMQQFKNTAEYYSTAFHELTHSTGHSKRLNRLDNTAFFGSEEYGKEELVAEIGASALVNHVGLETASSFRNNVAYIQNWMKAIKKDKRMIVSAAGKAEKAVNLILGA